MGVSGTEQHTLQTHFGAFLKMRRDQWSVRQREVLLYLQGWTQTNYSRLESGAIAPAFDQLLPIYASLQQAGVQWDAVDRQQYLVLARKRIEEKKRHTEQHSEHEWADLRYQLANVDFLLDEPDEIPDRWSPPKPLQAETRHLLGREEWLATITRAIQTHAPKKLVVLHGPVGIGKSSELHRLMQHFIQASEPAYHVIWIPLLPAERGSGPESSLTLLLGNLLAESGAPPPTPEMASWQKQQRLLFAHLEQSPRPLVILVDNAENALMEDGSLSACWEEFLTHFLRRQHRATLILATKEWPGWPGRDRGLVYESMVPPLDMPTGILLLQQQGLEAVSVEQLQEVWRRVGGIPLYLEWVASLAQNPHQLDEWQSFDMVEGHDDQVETGEKAAQEISQRLTRLLAESTLLRGHLASKLRPLLERLIEKRLSVETRALLDSLAVCNVPLGKTALQAFCEHPGLINELRNASLLVPYAHRVQVLPVVADVVARRLAEEQARELEERVMQALKRWKKEGSINNNEAGNVIAELVTLLIKHHRLLDAAQQLLPYRSLISNSGYAPRLAQFTQEIMSKFDWHTTPETECGGLLLRQILAPFLGKPINQKELVIAYQHILNAASTEQVKLPSSVEAFIIGSMTRSVTSEYSFEEARAFFEISLARLALIRPTDEAHNVYLLHLHAQLLGRWSDTIDVQGEGKMARTFRMQTIDLYRQCITALLAKEDSSPLETSLSRIRLSSCFNDLASYLARDGQFEEALQIVESGLELKEQGYLQFSTLASAYGEKAEILMELGRYQEALLFDEKAVAEAQRLANTGHTLSREEVWMYLANRGRLYLRLGRVEEAEQLLREALPRIHARRSIYRMFAKDALNEIDQWKKTNASHYQLDWRWVERYRKLCAYDTYWWWAQAGPFNYEEQRQWNNLFKQELEETTKEQLGTLIAQSRERELRAAIQEQREPRLCYSALAIEEVRKHIEGLLQLDTEISQLEPNAIVRRLYHGAIDEEVRTLRLIEATYENNNARFWELTRGLFPEPTSEEMEYALSCLSKLLKRGLVYEETRAISQQLIQFLSEQLHLSFDFSSSELDIEKSLEKNASSTSRSEEKVSPQAAKRFFEKILHENGYDNWQVIIDANAQSARVEQGLRQLFLTGTSLSVDRVIHNISHELAGHTARCIAGENSPFGLLGIHTKNSLETEEGLAMFYDRQTAVTQGQAYDSTVVWIGTLSTGLASGVVVPAQTFRSLLTFFELFYALHRMVTRVDTEVEMALKKARKLAFMRCLRTYRGVPDLEQAAVCLTKDALYLRGLWKIESAVVEDETVLDRLAVGVVALEQLPDLQELGIIASPQPLRKLANAPNLRKYIQSFEEGNGHFAQPE